MNSKPATATEFGHRRFNIYVQLGLDEGFELTVKKMTIRS